MRDYKIRNTELGWKIKKIKKDNSGVVLFRTGKLWSYKKAHARTYITQDDAVSALVLSKRQQGVEDFWK